MPNKKNRITITVASILAFMALILGVYVSHEVNVSKHIDPTEFNGTLLDKPREVSSFSLMGIDDVPFTNASLQGHWTMVFFGFTHCGTVCPTTMANLSKMYRLLEEKGLKKLPQVVMITVDPERDSLETLAHYVKAFDPHFYGARGDETSTKVMTQEMGIAYTKIAQNSNVNPQSYDIEHTGTVILFNPEGKLSAFFTMPHDAPLLVKDYLLLVSVS